MPVNPTFNKINQSYLLIKLNLPPLKIKIPGTGYKYKYQLLYHTYKPLNSELKLRD